MSDGKMSPDALHDLLSNIGDEYPSTWLRLRDHIAALERERDEWKARAESCLTQAEGFEVERDAALADNAALVMKMRAAGEALHRGGYVDLATGGKNPGAALLEEHRKALVRARNEGLEEAAEWARVNTENGEANALVLRLMMEPEE